METEERLGVGSGKGGGGGRREIHVRLKGNREGPFFVHCCRLT